MNQPRDTDLWHVVRALQKAAGGGVAKAVNMTVFFDSRGRVIGRCEVKIVKMIPGNGDQFVGLLFDDTSEKT